MKLTSYFDYLTFGKKYLETRGICDAKISSERLLGKILSKTKMELVLDKNSNLSRGEQAQFFTFLRKRARFYPLQYLTQEVSFRNIDLSIEEGVLIPRSETELLIDEMHRIFSKKTALKVLDIGTGSGNIALSIADEFSEARVWAVDVCEKALQLARKNASNLNLASRVSFIKSNFLDALNENLKFDLIISNPPYIPLSEKADLQEEVLFEPDRALFSGETGLEAYSKILGEAKKHLTNEGYLIFEIGYNQAVDLEILAKLWSYEIESIKKDYSENNRIVILRNARK